MGRRRVLRDRLRGDLADLVPQVKIAVLKERAAGERRVAATPETIRKFIGLGAELAVEAGAGGGASGARAGYAPARAARAGRAPALKSADNLLRGQGPPPHPIGRAPPPGGAGGGPHPL